MLWRAFPAPWSCSFVLLAACHRAATPAAGDAAAAPGAAARVDFVAVRDALAGPDADDERRHDVELSARLVALALARASSIAVLVDEHGAALRGEAPATRPVVDLTAVTIDALRRPPLSTFHWLVGAWSGRDGEATIRETWCPRADGSLVADNRTTVGDRQVAFERIAIADDGGRAVYLARPGGREDATPFHRTDPGTAPAAVFENPTHDFPHGLLYLRDGDALHVTVNGREQGELRTLEFHWTREGDVDALIRACASLETAR